MTINVIPRGVDLFDQNSQRPTTEGLGPILAHGERKLFSPTLLAVVEGIPFFPYIYIYIYILLKPFHLRLFFPFVFENFSTLNPCVSLCLICSCHRIFANKRYQSCSCDPCAWVSCRCTYVNDNEVRSSTTGL
jgi:hypothetical protein